MSLDDHKIQLFTYRKSFWYYRKHPIYHISNVKHTDMLSWCVLFTYAYPVRYLFFEIFPMHMSLSRRHAHSLRFYQHLYEWSCSFVCVIVRLLVNVCYSACTAFYCLSENFVDIVCRDWSPFFRSPLIWLIVFLFHPTAPIGILNFDFNDVLPYT